jgi:hypothetical protein
MLIIHLYGVIVDRYSWLERQLDRLDLTDEEFWRYTREINALQDQINKRQAEAKQQRLAKLQLQQAHIELLRKEGRMAELVDEYGRQFIDEYSITENYTLISNASRDRNPNQQNVWEHSTHEDAVKKLHELLYYRVYDHYFRNRQT